VGGGGVAVPNKRRQKNKCRELKDKRDLCYTLHTLQHKIRSNILTKMTSGEMENTRVILLLLFLAVLGLPE
jgi:hypothetical protein